MLQPYASVFEQCELFVIARKGFSASLPKALCGVPIPAANIIDPQASENADFLGLLRHLDQLCFGPNGMAMPSWVFYDCAVMPGGFFGLGIRAQRLELWCLDAMKVPAGYTGLVPVSQMIAIPMLAGFAPKTASAQTPDSPHTWLIYSLESINQVSPGFAPANLLRLTLALGLQLFPIDTLYGTTQWRSHKLATYIDLGPIELVTAYTPAHSLPKTCSFRLDVRPHNLATSLTTLLATPHIPPPPRAPTGWIDPDDSAALHSLQREIESGVRIHLVGRPEFHGAQIRIPLRRSQPEDDVRRDPPIAPLHEER